MVWTILTQKHKEEQTMNLILFRVVDPVMRKKEDDHFGNGLGIRFMIDAYISVD